MSKKCFLLSNKSFITLFNIVIHGRRKVPSKCIFCSRILTFSIISMCCYKKITDVGYNALAILFSFHMDTEMVDRYHCNILAASCCSSHIRLSNKGHDPGMFWRGQAHHRIIGFQMLTGLNREMWTCLPVCMHICTMYVCVCVYMKLTMFRGIRDLSITASNAETDGAGIRTPRSTLSVPLMQSRSLCFVPSPISIDRTRVTRQSVARRLYVHANVHTNTYTSVDVDAHTFTRTIESRTPVNVRCTTLRMTECRQYNSRRVVPIGSSHSYTLANPRPLYIPIPLYKPRCILQILSNKRPRLFYTIVPSTHSSEALCIVGQQCRIFEKKKKMNGQRKSEGREYWSNTWELLAKLIWVCS